MKEIWKDVVGFEGKYIVSNIGNVASILNRHGRKMEPFPLKKMIGFNKKYWRVFLCRKGERTLLSVHRLVLEAFIGKNPEGYECAHLNGDPFDNRVENLKWVTHSENLAHKKLHGTERLGETHHNSKFKDHDVVNIRNRFKYGDSSRSMALEYKVNTSTIFRIVSCRSWQHLPSKVRVAASDKSDEERK